MTSLEFVVKSIMDQGRLLTLNLHQEIRTEVIDQAEIIKQRIDGIEGLDEDSKAMMKKVLPAMLAPTMPKQSITISPIQMSITVTRQIYERMGAPKVGDIVEVNINKKS